MKQRLMRWYVIWNVVTKLSVASRMAEGDPMQRLIESGLMYSNLFHVDSPVLVDRYNRALEHLTGATTQLSEFHVDVSGYSPEVGSELGDHQYLNHGGVNRQFILLSNEQGRCPLLNAHFSTSRQILNRFIRENERQLFALTATDAIAGELENSVFSVESPRDLFDIRQIKVVADTTNGTIAKAGHLARLVDRFHDEKDGWFNEQLINEMIDVARCTGDVTRNPVQLQHAVFEQRNFWTSLFGGLYIFQDMEKPSVVVREEKYRRQLPSALVMLLDDRRDVARFLSDNELVETVVKFPGDEGVAVLRRKLDLMLGLELAKKSVDSTGHAGSRLRRLAARSGVSLPMEYEGLASIVRWAEAGGTRPKVGISHPAYFATLRAADTPVKDLVNMLLAELVPNDVLQLYICHKDEFYRRYRSWPREVRDFSVDAIVREYISDKDSARAMLFGSNKE
ncbi:MULTISPECIES: DUF6638 family protein [unclassified Halomonas]|uniref:DUF6638 family protein n=1 Tax=unclassified Halomonas TaxID=2609666 RepID=UPI00138DDEA2|nr:MULTISPECIES: DUF6638 family protein [unclassified Halomonas]MCJ8284578.1 hypothetical protein [Halomonas sp.]MCO7214072.1 hypothetical protein [Halomonas sp. OfavH-34-E]NQY69632.1 hypothetical protein [Halomonas sp.]